MEPTNRDEYVYPRFAFNTGWPEVIKFDGTAFVRIRDGVPTVQEHGGGLGDSALYARVVDLSTGELDLRRQWIPSTSINANFEKSKLIDMSSSPWTSNEELATAGRPTYTLPDNVPALLLRRAS